MGKPGLGLVLGGTVALWQSAAPHITREMQKLLERVELHKNSSLLLWLHHNRQKKLSISLKTHQNRRTLHTTKVLCVLTCSLAAPLLISGEPRSHLFEFCDLF